MRPSARLALVLRPFDPDDVPKITAIYADAVRTGTASYEIDPPDEAEMRRRLLALAEGGFPVRIAAAGTEVLGYAYAGAFRTRPAYRFLVEDSVYVAREAQGRGVGSALLAGIVEAATAGGFRQMLAVIGDGHDHSPSLLLHLRHGFRLVGRIEASGWKHGRWLDTAFMQRVLGEGAATDP